MRTSEEGNPSLETQNEINLGTSSNGTHHDLVEDDGDCQDQNQIPLAVEETAIVEQFDNLELQSNGDAANMVKEEEEEEVIEEEEKKEKIDSYPLRPNAADCAFYIKTGTCQFGLNCRFNHPAKRVFKPVGEKDRGTEEFNGVVHDTGKIECKYFSAPGGCKYGDACRYTHSEKIETKDPELNFLGLPIRLTEKDCTFYMRTGTCAYGANCRFNHPDPTATNELEPGNSLANGYCLRSDNNFPKANDLMHSSVLLQGTLSNGTNLKNSFPYASKMGSYHQGMSQNAEFNQDQGPVSLSANKLPFPHQIVNSSKNTDSVTHYERLIQIEEFPERPGQPDCDYFLKTGDCKYRSSCRYNHPISRSTRLRLPPLSSKGLYSRSAKVSPVETMELHNSNSTITRKNGMRSANHQTLQNGEFPERPGQPECEFFMKTGNCKYKSACRYHHPMNRLSTSSPCPYNEKGLPLRPGAKICRNYEQQGTCQYGHKCLFNHPDDLSPTAEDQHNLSTNVADAANFQPPVSNNTVSDWGDGWVM